MDLHALMDAIAAAFMDPLRSAVDGVADVGLPIVWAAIPLMVGMQFIRAGVAGAIPTGAVMNSFLIFGISIFALETWPDIIHGTMDQIEVISGLAGNGISDPFETATAGAALATLAFDHASSMAGLFGENLMALLLFVVGILILICYLLISYLSLVAWVEFLGATVLLGPLVAFLPIVGFNNAGFVPISFMVSSTIRIVAIALIATYGTDLIANPSIGLPGLDEPMTWLRAFVAFGCSLVLLGIAWTLPEALSGVLRGMVGFSGGVGALRTAIGSAGSSLIGGVGGMAAAAAGGSRGGGGGGGGGSASTAGGTPNVQSTSTPVNSRQGRP